MWLALLLLLLAPPGEQADAEAADKAARENARIQARIKGIDSRVNALTDKLDTLSAGSEKLSDEVGRLELQRALIHSKIEKHELQLEEASFQLAQNQVRRTEMEKEAEVQRRRIASRLRTLYKRGKLGHAQILLKQSQLSDLINAYHYARVLTRRDSEALAAYVATIEGLERVNAELERIRASAEATRKDLRGQQDALKSLLAERARKLEAIRKEAGQNVRLLQELELEKDEMLMMVRRLIEADKDPMDLRVPISRYQGRLPWPAKGRITRKFGVYKDPEFNTRQRQNGIDIAMPIGTPVTTVYSGRVLYADWFKSYGNVVIVDHGEKVVSFYAHLSDIAVTRNAFLEKDALIGTSGDTGSLDGAMLHFEIRRQTEPENPLDWLKRR